LTLSLRVLGKRPDGFHEIEALVVSIADPHDIVEARPVPHPGGVTLTVAGETADVPEGPRNLAWRAAEDLLLRAGRSGHGVQLNLRKKIPAGSGLGGGSADAAATLLVVHRLLEVDLDDAVLLEIAAGLGSDVPFCLTGGAAWMRGRGELLEPVSIPTGIGVLVAIPPYRLSTPTVYEAWDALGGPLAERVIAPPASVAAVEPELTNDLEPAAEMVEPRLREFRDALEAVVGAPALLAGSGAAYVVPLDADGPPVALMVRKVSRALHVPVAAATTVSRGVRLGTG
jgi:4-diphosphocytidyl-2-C-methyl-D-erythritol kinase